ncbi:MAG: kynureninase [Burkholderiaceae bacterium]|nr:kynureninase [Burkholderiaceae bacterium]
MSGVAIDRAACEALDAADPLRGLRALYELAPGLVYLDGNSLGPLPRTTVACVERGMREAWGRELIRSWNTAGWIDLPQRIGDAIAPLIGAGPGEVVAADSTSVNLFKVLSAAIAMRPKRSTILSENGNFPTDLYIAQGLIAQTGGTRTLRLVERTGLLDAIDADTAVVMLTQVDYRSGSRLDLAEVTARAHALGALVVWDLAHSAGAFEVALNEARADFAVGCGYKYLNGGPGAPAFVFVARRHQHDFVQPLSGWMGHAAPFDFDPAYRPADGISRALVGTPPILSMLALECGVAAMRAAAPLGGMAAIRRKSLALSDLFIELVERRCAGFGLRLVTPRAHAARASQASFAIADGATGYAVIQALIARAVIGDFRAPDVLRFGFAPSYLRFVDIWDAVERLREVLVTRAWDRPEFRTRLAVT